MVSECHSESDKYMRLDILSIIVYYYSLLYIISYIFMLLTILPSIIRYLSVMHNTNKIILQSCIVYYDTVYYYSIRVIDMYLPVTLVCITLLIL